MNKQFNPQPRDKLKHSALPNCLIKDCWWLESSNNSPTFITDPVKQASYIQDYKN